MEHELGFAAIDIHDEFWDRRLAMNRNEAIFYQWTQLEATGCIDNFRIVAKLKDGIRAGRFYSDSDAYKWLEAACWIWGETVKSGIISASDRKLYQLIEEFVDLIGKTQTPDGYLYTYNQFFFPDRRWVCQQIEHELYCLGHLIEAGCAHAVVFCQDKPVYTDPLLQIALKAADLCVRDFLHAKPTRNDGHEEMELALLKMAEILSTTDFNPQRISEYIDLAFHLLSIRGHIHGFPLHMIGQGIQSLRRANYTLKQQSQYRKFHPEYQQPVIPPEVYKKFTFVQSLRGAHIGLSGRLLQQHKPFLKMTAPEGHAVRFVYFMTGWTKYYRLRSDPNILSRLKLLWDRMVSRRMYLTGGIGAVPIIEGFGWDYELPNKEAYGETCAALGNIFWNWEMLLATGEPCYADLLEWQLYNAASSGIAADGHEYLYRNPLAADPKLKREPWFGTPCCPSNLSRTWATLGKYCYTISPVCLTFQQYIGNNAEIVIPQHNLSPISLKIEMTSGFPWRTEARVLIKELVNPGGGQFTLQFRIPHYCDGGSLHIIRPGQGDEIMPLNVPPSQRKKCASGFTPYDSFYLPVMQSWTAGTKISLKFNSPIRVHHAPPQVRANRGRIAISKGPLVYCVESCDNPSINLFETAIASADPSQVREIIAPNLPHYPGELGPVSLLQGKWENGTPLMAIPYFLWANRGLSSMAVWLCVLPP
jgi:DUF1680 family protein